jgi:hypothetical protein
MQLGAPSGRQGRRTDRIATLTVAILLLMAVAAPGAKATLRVVNHNDPAGDPTPITYRLSTPDRNPLIPDFQLPDEQCVLPQDAEHCGASFGVDPTVYGPTYTIQALVRRAGRPRPSSASAAASLASSPRTWPMGR